MGDAELSAAVNLVEQGDYTMAITRLAALIEKQPGSEAANEALYHLGRAYEGIGAHGEALERYAEYLVRVPGGEHEADALTAFRRVHALQEEQFPTPETIERELRDLRAAYETEPENVAAGLAVALALWQAGRYEEAAGVYARLINVDPSVLDNPEVKRRIEIGPDGTVIPLTPEEQSRRDAEAQPVVVYNTRSYLGGRDLFTQKPRWYIVTGEVMNRSEQAVDDVQVQTTIYAFGNDIHDTDIQYLGRLNPGQARAFTARFTQFENVNNVSRFETTVTHD